MYISTTTKILYKKARRKTDYSYQKLYRQVSTEQNNQKTKLGRKTTLWAFQVTNKRNLTWQEKGKVKRETESLLIAAQNNTMSKLK